MFAKLKAFAMAFIVMLAAGVLAAAPASAEEFFFNSEAKETTLTGTQEESHVFTTTAGAVQCKKASFTGSMFESELSTVEVTPSYSECTMSGGTPGTATFAMNGCVYRFSNGNIEGEKHEGTVGIVCPGGKEIVVQVKLFGSTVCTIDVPAQSGLGTVTYTDIGENEGAEITANINVKEKLKYSHTGMCGNGSASTGSVSGKYLVKGESGEAKAGVSTTGLTVMDMQPAQVSFKGLGAGATKAVTFTNNGNIAIYTGTFSITPNENTFKILGTSSCTKGGFVGAFGACTFIIEYLTGVPVQFQQLVVKFGGSWSSQKHQRISDIVSL